MYKLITQIALIALLAGYIYMQKQDIKSMELKNSNLQEQLKVCKTEGEAKEFESKWADEFSKGFNLELESIGFKNEKNSTQNDSNIIFTDSF